MKRYSTIKAFEAKIIDFNDQSNKSFEKSVTDDSFYVPESELIKRLRNGVTYGQSLQAAYDFVDGKDTGIAVPIDRYKGIDRSEVSEYLNSKTDTVVEAINEAKKSEKKSKTDKPTETVVNNQESVITTDVVNNPE